MVSAVYTDTSYICYCMFYDANVPDVQVTEAAYVIQDIANEYSI
jgi:hypothetical protein